MSSITFTKEQLDRLDIQEAMIIVEGINDWPYEKDEDLRLIARIGNLKAWIKSHIIEVLNKANRPDIIKKLNKD